MKQKLSGLSKEEIKIPFFSVVIPVYNKKPHIQRSLNSVLNQSYTNFELIIINDASTDGSLEEIQKFSDPRIRILNRTKPGPGGYAARNLGIKEARADWIAFLDADDEWFPEHLEIYFNLIGKNRKIEFLGSGYIHCYGEVQKYDRFYKKNNKNIMNISFTEYLREIIHSHPFYTSVVCAKKELLLNVKGFPAGKMRRGGDADTWLRCIESAGGMLWSNHLGAKYFRDSVNMVTKTIFYTEQDILQPSIAHFVRTYHGEISNLLKKRSNNMAYYAWNQNMRMKITKNFSLKGKLYREVQPLKVFIYEVFSAIPMFLSKSLYSVSFHIIQKIRKFRD